MTRVLASPSEPKEIVEPLEAIASPLCEDRGADYLLYTKQGLVGLQRKQVPHDFVSSFTDGRMARETSLLAEYCKFSWVICEGRFRFFPDGRLAVDRKEPSRFTRKQIYGMLFDIKLVKGIDILYTDDPEDTIGCIRALVDFMSREKHLGLYTRPSAKGAWYVPTTKDIDLWLLQSFEGVGPAVADSIISHFGGRVPLRWSCTLRDLIEVPKLRPKVAKALWDSLPHEEVVQESIFDSMRRKLRNV